MLSPRTRSAGDDILRGFGGNDSLSGGSDDDLFGGTGDDTLEGGLGDDDLVGGQGNETAIFTTVTNVKVALIWGASESAFLGDDTLSRIENVTTDDGDDLVLGSEYANALDTGDGDDTLGGDGGDDLLLAGDGDDRLYGDGDGELVGGDDDDKVFGNEGDDVLKGGKGADQIDGHEGLDTMTGGDGADVFAFHIGQSGVTSGQRDVVTGFDDLELVGNDSFSAATGSDQFSSLALPRPQPYHCIQPPRPTAELLPTRLHASRNGDSERSQPACCSGAARTACAKSRALARGA